MVNAIHNIIVNFVANVKGFNAGMRSARAGLVRTGRDVQGFRNRMFRLGATLGLVTNRFQFWALSLLFLGMQVRRIFEGIARSGVSSFTKIMESSGFAGSALQQLATHWEFLKFTVGSAINTALTPLIPVLTRVINAIARWVREHPKLTTVLITGGIVFGVVAQILGQLILSLSIIGPAITGLTKLVNGLSAAFKFLAANPIILLIAGFVALILIIKNIFEPIFGRSILTIGFWAEFFKSALRGILRVAVIILDSLATAFAFGFNLIIAIVIRAVDTINDLIRNINLRLGTNIGTIGTSGLTGALSDFQQGDLVNKFLEFEQGSFLAPSAAPSAGGGGAAGGAPAPILIENVHVQSDNLDGLLAELKAQLPPS